MGIRGKVVIPSLGMKILKLPRNGCLMILSHCQWVAMAMMNIAPWWWWTLVAVMDVYMPNGEPQQWWTISAMVNSSFQCRVQESAHELSCRCCGSSWQLILDQGVECFLGSGKFAIRMKTRTSWNRASYLYAWRGSQLFDVMESGAKKVPVGRAFVTESWSCYVKVSWSSLLLVIVLQRV